jgi:hypothetical protein
MGERLHAKAFCEIFMEEASEKVFLRKKKRIKQQNRFSRRRPAGDYPHTV